jgi:hypothetical protein
VPDAAGIEIELIRSLVHRRSFLAETGKRTGGLSAIKEAVTVLERLVQEQPDFEAALASALKRALPTVGR